MKELQYNGRSKKSRKALWISLSATCFACCLAASLVARPGKDDTAELQAFGSQKATEAFQNRASGISNALASKQKPDERYADPRTDIGNSAGNSFDVDFTSGLASSVEKC